MENARFEAIRFDRVPPVYIDAEIAVLSACMQPESSLMTVAEIIEIVKSDDFYKEAHAKIFSAILSLYQRNIPPDMLMIIRELDKMGELEKVGDVPYLQSIEAGSLGLGNIKHYAELCRDTSRRRKLIRASVEIYNNAFDDMLETDSLLESAESSILNIKDLSSAQFVNARSLVNSTLSTITKAYQSKTSVSGIPSGFKKLDYLTTGFYPGDYIIVAGRTSMGKSIFVKDIAIHLAFTEKMPVGFFTLETSKEQLMLRIVSSLGDLDGFNLRTGHLSEAEYQKAVNVINEIYKGNLYIDDSSGLTDMELRSRIRRMKYQHGIELIIIDYISYLSSYKRTENRQQEISSVSRSLKAIAKDFKIPVIAVAQINRGPEDRSNKRPLLSDLRESGSLEMDADIVCLLYRDSYYNKDSMDDTTEVSLEKQRNGPTGIIKLDFNKQCTKFVNKEKE